MRIMVDTNILISALIFRSEHLTNVIEKAAEEYTLVLFSYVIDEINTVIERKFPKHKSTINKFLSKLSFELLYSPKEIEGESLFDISVVKSGKLELYTSCQIFICCNGIF